VGRSLTIEEIPLCQRPEHQARWSDLPMSNEISAVELLKALDRQEAGWYNPARSNGRTLTTEE